MTSIIFTKGGYLYSVSILRTISCLGVLAVHLGQRMHLNGIIRTITDYGETGVYLFFIVSGYLFVNSVEKNDKRMSKVLCNRLIHMISVFYLLFYLITA